MNFRFGLVVCVLFGALLTLPAIAAAGSNGLSGTYYRDAAFKQRVVTRVDRQVNFSWGSGAPRKYFGADTFTVRWRGSVAVPTAGSYTLYVRANDGARLWIDGKLVINHWTRNRIAREWAAPISLSEGRHSVRIDYLEYVGYASARFSWKGPGIAKQVVPNSQLFVPGAPPPPPPLPPPPPNIPEGPAQNWSDPETWGGTIPANGSSVTIPAGKVVELDQNVSLANLTVDGTLQFARRDILLEADWIVVHGKLQVGTEATPFTDRATIRLRDMSPGENVLNMGDKVVGVIGGTLELHGEDRLGWTHLGANAAAGATQITLSQASDWRAGDRIAIASTDYDHDQAEEATVTAVAGNAVTLDHALAYSHFGTIQPIAGWQVDERAEVALLSRNVTIEGEATTSANGFGAQVLLHSNAIAHVEGIELQRVGQAGILRRYPIHFHMLGDGGASSYLRDSSVHHSSNRCITIHGTNNATISGNVCYAHAGHGFFLEDGAEHDNIIEGNLGFGTVTPADGKRLLASDESPGTYWITNLDNTVRNNVAAGSEGNGFWLALPEHPTGLFASAFPAQTAATWNRRMALTEFTNNTTHSNDGDGLHFDSGPNPDGTTEAVFHRARQDPADTSSPVVVTQFTGLNAYKNRGEGAWLRGSDQRLIGATLADNAIGTTFASNESFLQNSLVVGETANVGTPQSWEVDQGLVGRNGRTLPRSWDPAFPIRGFEFYDGRVGTTNTTFANFQPYTADSVVREQSALGYLLDNDFSIHPKNFVTAATFVNAKRVYLEDPEVGHDGDVSAVFLDTDGSVTGTAGRSVMTNNPFLFGASCTANVDWNAQLCTGDYASLYVGTGDGDSAAVKPVTITRSDGQVQTLQASAGGDTGYTSVLTNNTYAVAFNGGTPSTSIFTLANGQSRWVKVAIPRAEGFKVTQWGCNIGQVGSWCYGRAASLAALNSATTSSYWYDNLGDADPATGTLHLKITSEDSDYNELQVEPL